MPCYAFDGELKKHDLNPLIKISGGYLVDDADPDSSLFINVCRDIGRFGGGGGEGFLRRLCCLCPSTIIPSWISVSLNWPSKEAGRYSPCISPPLGRQSALVPSQILSRPLVHLREFSLADVLIPGFLGN